MAIDSPFNGVAFYSSALAVAPGGSGALVAVNGPPKGFYRITLKYGFGAVAEATTINNLYLGVNGTSYQSFLPLPLGPVNSIYEFTIERVWLDGVNNLYIVVFANASAGAVYHGSITAVQLAN